MNGPDKVPPFRHYKALVRLGSFSEHALMRQSVGLDELHGSTDVPHSVSLGRGGQTSGGSLVAPSAEATPVEPSDFPRRVLLSVVGQSPQVVTETVFALAVVAQSSRAFVPTEVHVITTAVGARNLVERVLSGPDAVWQRLQADYQLGPIQFDASNVHVVARPSGEFLHDIRTADDNACVADAIAECVRRFTSDPDCALHVSLAGGRKTMGFYAGYALSMLGRSQDRLSHVLVPPAYEALPGFYYPTPEACPLPGRDGATTLDAALGTVELAQIPFVRLRNLLPPALLAAPSGFAAMVASAGTPIAAPRLRLDVERLEAVADGQALKLTPMQFALLAALAQRARAGKPALPAPPREVHDPQWAAEVLADLRAAFGVMHVDSDVEESLARDCSGSKVAPHLSRLRKVLRSGLGPGRVALYFDDGDTHRFKRYRVPLRPDAIEIVRARAGCKLADPPGAEPGSDTHRQSS